MLNEIEKNKYYSVNEILNENFLGFLGRNRKTINRQTITKKILQDMASDNFLKAEVKEGSNIFGDRYFIKGNNLIKYIKKNKR